MTLTTSSVSLDCCPSPCRMTAGWLVEIGRVRLVATLPLASMLCPHLPASTATIQAIHHEVLSTIDAAERRRDPSAAVRAAGLRASRLFPSGPTIDGSRHGDSLPCCEQAPHFPSPVRFWHGRHRQGDMFGITWRRIRPRSRHFDVFARLASFSPAVHTHDAFRHLRHVP